MGATYEFWICDDAGHRLYSLNNDLLFASYSRTNRGYGVCQIGFPYGGFPVSFKPDMRLDVWRKPDDTFPLRREGSFLLRKWVHYRRDDGMEVVEFFGRSPLDLLRRQTVVQQMWPFWNKNMPIDDMMKKIFNEQFLPAKSIYPPGELDCDGIDSLGPTVKHSFKNKVVLDVMKELRDISFQKNLDDPTNNRKIYFDVVEDDSLVDGGFGYRFRTFANLRGSDRTDGVIFSPKYGNLTGVVYYQDHIDSATYARNDNPNGQSLDPLTGILSPAATVTAISPAIGLSRWNYIVTASQQADLSDDEAQALVNKNLQEKAAKSVMNQTFLNSPGGPTQPRSLYGVDWDMGDLVRVHYAGMWFHVEVSIVYVGIDSQGVESISGMSDTVEDNG